jgi:D-sedoheptulose 7-phosphate isomerase
MSELPQLRDAIEVATQTVRALSSLESQMTQAVDVIDQCLRAVNKLLVCGNGGSAADASHFVTELVVRFAKDRRALPEICLTSDSGILTAAGNDYGFDEIFARQVAALSSGRRAHWPDHLRKIQECGARLARSDSASNKDDRVSRAR